MLDNVAGALQRRHLVRDLVGTIGPFVAFTLAAGVVLDASELLEAMSASIGGLALAIAAYVLAAFFAGKLIGAAGVVLTRWAVRLPRVGERFSYAHWYGINREAILALYRQTFTDLPDFNLSLTGKVNALKSYFGVIHPGGLADVERQFMLVDISRAAFVYAGLLFVFDLSLAVSPHPWLLVACVVIMWLAAAATRRRIEKVVRTEMEYLVAAARLKADRSS